MSWENIFITVFGRQSTFESVGNLLVKKILTQFDYAFFNELRKINQAYEKQFGLYRDFFGDWIIQRGIELHKQHEQVLTPYEIVEFMSASTVMQLQEHFQGKPILYLDPFCGTGRFMLGTVKHSEQQGLKNYDIVCIDIDILMVAYSVTNALLHGINCVIIHADTLAGKIDKGYIILNGMLRETTARENIELEKKILRAEVSTPDVFKLEMA